MRLSEVLGVIEDLAEAGCSVWVAGGWGVDALVGRQTRPHRDLDLAIDSQDESVALAVLERRGYHIETDWRPVRVELTSVDRGWVDLHPLVFDDARHGRQADLDGGCYEYPPDAFVQGRLDDARVPCLSRDQQLRFHSGYEPREVDCLDLLLLHQLSAEG